MLTDVDEAPAPRGRAGRNLPAAIAVGLTLGALIIGTLYTVRPLFVVVIVAAITVGTWEMCRAVRKTGAQVPFLPVAVGGAVMIVAGYQRGSEALLFGFVATILALLVWRLADSGPRPLQDVAAGVFVTAYVPFLAGFAALLTAQQHGAVRVTAFIATAVCSDTGGYAAGVWKGRHPLAPSVSPKKTWEGLAGSLLACGLFGILYVSTFLDIAWWEGVLFGLAVTVTATVGDLGESLIKRDIGIKDMGNLLPGHGGMMDRLDSLLITAPVCWLLLTAFAPVS